MKIEYAMSRMFESCGVKVEALQTKVIGHGEEMETELWGPETGVLIVQAIERSLPERMEALKRFAVFRVLEHPSPT